MDEFGQFFAQMPPGLIANICTIFVGLGLMMIYFAYVKPTRQQRKRDAELRTLRAAQQQSELPNLDMLMGDAEDPTLLLSGQRPDAVLPMRQQGVKALRMHDGGSTYAVEVLAILRNTENDQLIVQLDGIGYQTLADQPQVKARFTALMQELAQVVNTLTPASDRSAPTVPTPAVNTEALDTTEHLPAVPREVAAAFSADDLDFPDLDVLSDVPPTWQAAPPPPPLGDGAMPGDLPKVQSDAQIRSGGFLRAAKIETEPVQEINLAASIETYLQYKLRHAEAFPGRSIHVHPAVHGGVVIQVDHDYFDSVVDITDPQVRGFIAQAIEEWQARQ